MFRRFLYVLLVSAVLWNGCGDGHSGQGERKESSSTATKSPERKSFVVTDKSQQFRDALQFEVFPGELGKLVLRVTRVAEPIALHIPLGTVAWGDRSNRLAPKFIVWRDTSIVVDKPQTTHTVEVLYSNVDDWGRERKNFRYRFWPAQPETPAHQFLQAVDVKKHKWTTVQIGLWAITQDISRKRLDGKLIRASNAFTAGLTEDLRVVFTYDAIRKTQLLLAELAIDPQQYRLFTDNRAYMEEAVQKYRLTDWSQKLSIGYSGNFFNSLDPFKREPEINELVFSYLENHSYFHYRQQALEYLLKRGGIPGTEEKIWQRVRNEKKRMVRLGAIATLLDRGDLRMEPLRLVYEYDEPVSKQYNHWFRTKRAKELGITIEPGKTLLEQWQQVGWQELAQKYSDLADIKRILAELQQAEAAFLENQMSPLATNKVPLVRQCLEQLSRRFPRCPQVIRRIEDIVVRHPSEDIRVIAISYLGQMQSSELFAFFQQILRQNATQAVVKKILDSSLKLSLQERQQLYLLAMQNPQRECRLAAIEKLRRQQKLDDNVEIVLLQLAHEDPSLDIQSKALDALIMTRSNKSFEVVRRNLAYEDSKYEKLILATIDVATNMLKDDATFALVKNAALSHPLAKVRKKAVARIYLLGNQYSLRDLFLDCLRNESDREVLYEVLARANAKMKKQPQYYSEVWALALQNRHQDVRARALGYLKQQKEKRYEQQIFDLAMQDSSIKVREQAFWALNTMKSPKAFSILQKWLQQDVSTKRKAIEYMIRYFGDDERTAELLTPLKNDPDRRISRKVQSYLQRRKKR